MPTTKIEWATRVWNPVTGCSHVSAGCDHCYAKRMAKRLVNNPKTAHKYRNGFAPTFHEEELVSPSIGKPGSHVFVCSMGDLFHSEISISDSIDIFHFIFHHPEHTFIILTKRPRRMLEFFCDCAFNPYGTPYKPLPNLWLGVSVEDQATANDRIPILLQIPAAIRFISAEPLLGPIDIGGRLSPLEGGGAERRGVNWIIAGGETGPGARPMHPDWVRSLRNQAAAAGVPFFFKSWGEYFPLTRDNVKKYPLSKIKTFEQHHLACAKVGKKHSGDTLDGQQYHQFPK